MIHFPRRSTWLLLPAVLAALPSCSSTQTPARPQDVVEAELASTRSASPAQDFAVALAVLVPQPVRRFPEVRSDVATALATPGHALTPAVEALLAAGWSADEVATMFTIAGAYNSGQPSDPSAARQVDLRGKTQAGLDAAERAVETFELDHSTTIDRETLLTHAYRLGTGGVQ